MVCSSDLNTNDKGNILNAYATVVSDNSTGEVSLFFGLDREAQNGAATVGYWFLQDPNFGLGRAINKNAYAFNGQHKDGKPKWFFFFFLTVCSTQRPAIG
jgi:hypothetical protein